MADVIACPECGRQLRVPEQYRGRQARCPSCAACFVTPASPPGEPEPVPVPRPETLTTVPAPSNLPDPALSRPVLMVSPLPEEDEPRGPRGNAVGLLAALAGLLVLIGLGVYLSRPKEPRWTPPRPAPIWENDDERRAELMEAFRRQKPLEADAIAEEVRPLLDEMGKGLKAGDAERILAGFDLDRFLDELGDLELLPPRGSPRRSVFVNAVRARMAQELALRAPLLAWEDYEIRGVKKLAGNEAALIVRHRAEGNTLKMRWWVSKRSGSWKVFDMEDLDIGVRMTAGAASAAEVGPGGMAAAEREVRLIGEAIRAVTVDQDLDAAERILLRAQGGKLPRKLEAVRLLMTAVVHYQRQRYKETLQTLDQADRANPDMPCTRLWRGCAHNRLEEWDKGLTNLKAYHDLLGDDAQVCYEMGEALRWLGRNAEAAACYRKSLDCVPTDSNTLLGLLYALGPGDKVDDLGRRFARLQDHHTAFETLAAACPSPQDGDKLEELARAMQVIDRDHPGAAGSLALVRVWKGQPAEAVKLFRAAVAGEKDPARRSAQVASFLRAVAAAGKPAEGYEAAPDPAEAFRVLAHDLKQRHQRDHLRRLIALHETKLAKDPLLTLYRADLLAQHQRYELADRAFRAAEKVVDAAELEPFHYSRVCARFHTAGALATLADVGPRKETFALLFSLSVWGSGGTDRLEALVEAYAKTDSHDPDLPRFRCRLRARQGRAEEAAVLFKALLAKEKEEQKKRQLIHEFLVDMAAAGKTIEGYQAAPDARQAFAILTADAADKDEPLDGLAGLIDAHRRRDPDDPGPGRLEGEAHLRTREWEKAVAAFAGAWKKAGKEERQSFHDSYLLALYRAGRWRQAYREVEPVPETFDQLAYLLYVDRKWGDLEALIEAHRPAAGDDPRRLLWEASLKARRKQPAEAVKLACRAFEKEPNEQERRDHVIRFVLAMDESGLGREGYRAVPDRSAAFDALASAMLRRRNEKELGALLAEHGKEHATDPAHRVYTAQLHLLRGEAKKAEELLEVVPPGAHWSHRKTLLRAKVKTGKAVALLESPGPAGVNFTELADLCVAEGEVRQLEALVAARRRADPEDTVLPIWDVEVRWLQRDYEAVVRLLKNGGEGAFPLPWQRWQTSDRLVRALVRLKRPKEALREAEASVKDGRARRGTLLVLAHAANGDVQQAMAAAAKAAPELVEAYYSDEDLGPILRGDAFRAFRQRFPEPKKQEARE